MLGSELGGRLWRYAKRKQYKAGEFLCRKGCIHHTLYLVQSGTVTSFVIRPDGTMKRVHSKRRGSFINESCLFLDHPANYSSFAVEDCEVWAIERKSMKELEAHDPFLGLEILRNILRISSVAKARFERGIEADYRGQILCSNAGSSAKTFGQSVLEKITVPNVYFSNNIPVNEGDSFKGIMWNYPRRHSFRHILLDSPMRVKEQDSSVYINPKFVNEEFKNIRPHLSVVMQRNAIDCFLHHAMDSTNFKEQTLKKRRFRRSFQSNNLLSVNMPKIAGEQRLDLKELQQAVMDLGFFPTEDEVEEMHKTLGSAAKTRVIGDKYLDGADVEEFVRMIEVLSLAPLSRKQLQSLRNIYDKHCDKEGRLQREDLSNLMNALGHPEDELELEMLMYEWDVNQKGYLDFDGFISLVAHVMKAEELDQQVENDFLTICGEDFEEIQHKKENLLNSVNFSISPQDIIHFCHSNDILLDAHIAEEMVFDACESGNGCVGLGEFITTMETVFRNESALPDQSIRESKMVKIDKFDQIPVTTATLNIQKCRTSSVPSIVT